MAKANITMDELLAQNEIAAVLQGEIATGTVASIKKHEILIDLGAQGIGVVPRREVSFSKNLNIGDEVHASVLEEELEDGRILLSLRKAAKDRGWEEVMKIMEEEQIVEVEPYDANRGGLLVEYEGVRGFLPVSQLSAEHYPRVASSDKEEILQRLNSLKSEKIKTRIIDVDRRANKLIFSEKEAIKDSLTEAFKKMSIGDTVKGQVTGVVDFGVFINVDGIEGLIHISEISWERVIDPNKYVKIGDEIEAKIIDIDKDRLNLSIKQLTEDPWMKEIEEFKKGLKVEGTITRITPFGAFVQISPSVEALVHVSELGEGDNINPENIFTLNEKKNFRILDIDKDNRKISLCLAN